jgi:hypothetical protein
MSGSSNPKPIRDAEQARAAAFRREASRQSRAVASSKYAETDQAFMESVSDFGPV